MARYILNAKEFTDAVYGYVQSKNSSWPRHDVSEWLKASLPIFGHPDFDWQYDAATTCAKEFLSEASTW